jgi:hypothetical protein
MFHRLIQLSVRDRDIVNKGVDFTGDIFGYITKDYDISSDHPALLDRFFIYKNTLSSIYLKCMEKDRPPDCHPGRLLKFRYSTVYESNLVNKSSLFENPPQLWTTEPGYSVLLHSMNIRPIVLQDNDMIEKAYMVFIYINILYHDFYVFSWNFIAFKHFLI